MSIFIIENGTRREILFNYEKEPPKQLYHNFELLEVLEDIFCEYANFAQEAEWVKFITLGYSKIV